VGAGLDKEAWGGGRLEAGENWKGMRGCKEKQVARVKSPKGGE